MGTKIVAFNGIIKPGMFQVVDAMKGEDVLGLNIVGYYPDKSPDSELEGMIDVRIRSRVGDGQGKVKVMGPAEALWTIAKFSMGAVVLAAIIGGAIGAGVAAFRFGYFLVGGVV